MKNLTMSKKLIISIILGILFISSFSFLLVDKENNNKNITNPQQELNNSSYFKSTSSTSIFSNQLITDSLTQTVFYFSETGSIYGVGNGYYGTFGIGNTNNLEFTYLNSYWDPYFDTSEIKDFYLHGSAVFVLLNNGEIWGWGHNEVYLLGNGGYMNETSPIRLDTIWNQYFDTSLIEHIYGTVDGAYSESLPFYSGATFIFLNDGSIYGHGANIYNELGLEVSNSFLISYPELISDDWNTFFDTSIIQSVNMNYSTIIITLDNGEVWGWGKNEGFLGNGNFSAVAFPMSLDTIWNFDTSIYNITSLYMNGHKNTYVFFDNGEIWGCGINNFGELGINTTDSQSSMIRLDTFWSTDFDPSDIIQFNDGIYFTIVFLNDNRIFGWGNASLIGNGSQASNGVSSFNTPIDVTSDWDAYLDTSKISKFYTGYSSSYIILDDNSIYVWGQNEEYELGIDFPNQVFYPQVAIKLSDFTSQWQGGILDFSFLYNKAIWGSGSLYYTIYTDDIDNPIVDSKLVPGLNDAGGTTTVVTSITIPDVYNIQITTRPDNQGIFLIDTPLALPEESFVNNVEFSDVLTNTAKITYTYYGGSSGDGQIQYSLDNGNTWVILSDTVTDQSTNNFTISGLDSNVEYTVIVAPVLNPNNRSNTSTTTFTTKIPSSISNLQASDITINSAFISYDYIAGNLNPGELEYSLDNGNTWVQITATNNNGANSFTIDNLDSSTNYNLILRPVREDNNTSQTSFLTLTPASTDTWWQSNSWWATLTLTILVVLIFGTPITLYLTKH